MLRLNYYPDLPDADVAAALQELLPNKQAVADWTKRRAVAQCVLSRLPSAANDLAAKFVYARCENDG